MAKKLDKISTTLTEFIEKQHLFFVGTAGESGTINVSPKGMDTFKVIDGNRVMWLNLTGSGNETGAHLLKNNRITIMFCAFEGNPLILRLYGSARIYHEGDTEWLENIKLFPEMKGARQIMDVHVQLVLTSCGFGVPLMDFQSERTVLTEWAAKKGPEGLIAYHKEKNTMSLDGYPTDLSK
jgi:predicted pyridoxine 5'-phosphate oxidase superfamily flavin-nucleotide-binding protein